MIIIENDGQRIVSTNYWATKHAQAGLFYLTWSAAAGRLLVPDSKIAAIAEMRTAKYVIVSRGLWEGRDAYELLFEDNTENPFSMHILATMSDRLLPETSQGAGFIITAVTRAGEQLRLPGKYRTVPTLPCLAAWSEQ